ncbi:MAG: 2-isopropylmalate synthase [Candidatus Gracilibacteria bacterium]|nr:2-isopropylmalate synthase [Candidatus Gracilibacteria bacterium]
MSNKIKIFDTTLRDGEQAPGFSMNIQEKLRLAHQLEALGVDVIEAGFPAASPEDFESVAKIAEELTTPEICGLARCHEGDIEKTLKAIEKAKKPRIHVFIATSDIHLEYKLQMSRDEAIKRAIQGVQQAKSGCDRVDFSPEDAGRSDRQYLVEILTEVIKAGADTINIPDTVGYLTPEEFGDLIKFLHNTVPGIQDCIISTHCHNDLGMAVANSLAGVANGARQIECTINGIGERAGNASLEEVVMAIKTRPELYNAHTDINTKLLLQTSKMLQSISGNTVQINKAIVGQNAFAHEAGIHQHGLLKNKATYEIMKPDDVGWNETNMVLGKHSGKAAILARLKELGIKLNDDQVSELMANFKTLADRKKDIYDEDLIMLSLGEEPKKHYFLEGMTVNSHTGKDSTASIRLLVGKKTVDEIAKGIGSVDAVYNCIIKATGLEGKLTTFHIDAVSPEREAVAVCQITWENSDGTEIRGKGRDTDTVNAAAYALVDILNKAKIREKISPYQGV